MADVKLLVAEAYLQTNQMAKALEQVNEIRQRARRSTLNSVPAVTPANPSAVTMQRIIDERMHERLGEEDIRWDDLRRWYKTGFINLGTWTKTDIGMGPQYDNSRWGFDGGIHRLMPIPIAGMNSNPKMLKSGQNTG